MTIASAYIAPMKISDVRLLTLLARTIHAHGHHRVIDAARRPVHDPGPPDQILAAHPVAADPHDPIRREAEPLDEVPIRAHHDPLEHCTRPRIRRNKPLPRRGPRQQLGRRPGASHGSLLADPNNSPPGGWRPGR